MGFEPQREHHAREGHAVFEGALDGHLPHERQLGTNDLVAWKGNDEGDVLEVPAGTVVAFSNHLLHTIGANHTDRMRRVYLAQYTPGVMLNPGTRQLRHNAVPLVVNGDQVTRG